MERFQYLYDLLLPHQTLVSWFQHKGSSILAHTTLFIGHVIHIGQIMVNFIKGNLNMLGLLIGTPLNAHGVTLLKVDDTSRYYNLGLRYDLILAPITLLSSITGRSIVPDVLKFQPFINTDHVLIIINLVGQFLSVGRLKRMLLIIGVSSIFYLNLLLL